MHNILKKITRCFNIAAAFAAKHSKACLLILLLSSLLLKLIAQVVDPAIGRDAALYLQIAQNWFDTGEIQAGIPPFLFFLIKCLMHLGLPAAVAGWTVNIALGSLIVPVGYGIAYELTANRKIALMAAAFFALHPGINDLSIEIQRDIPFLFFAGCSIWAALAGLRCKRWYYWLLAGCEIALAILTRYEALELVFLIPLWLFIQLLCRRLNWKLAIAYTCTFICAAGFFIWLMLLVMNCSDFRKMWDAKFQRFERQMEFNTQEQTQ